MSIDDKVPTISAIQLNYDKGTGEYTILVGIEEWEAARKYVVPRKDAVAFHSALQSALALAQEA